MKTIFFWKILVISLIVSFGKSATSAEVPRPDISVRYSLDVDKKGRKIWVGSAIYDTTVINRKQERLITVPVPSATNNPWHTFYFSIYNPSQFGQWMWYRYINTRGLHTYDPAFRYDPTFWEFQIYQRRQDPDPAKQVWVDVTSYVLNYKKYGVRVPGYTLGPIKAKSYYQWGEIMVKIRPRIGAKPGASFAFGCMLYYDVAMVSDFATASVVVK